MPIGQLPGWHYSRFPTAALASDTIPIATVTGRSLVKVEGGDKPPLQQFEPGLERDDLWLPLLIS